MIFQTAVRKFVGIHEKNLKWLFFWFFYPQISVIKTKKIWTKNAENFHNASIFFQIFTISKMKTRTPGCRVYATPLNAKIENIIEQ